MCGIVGVFKFRSQQAVSETSLKAMNDTLIHRGPDGGDVFIQGPLGLGHRRLAIIDLEAGKQPLHSADGQVTIVFNGEIYNFKALRDTLSAAGHHFQTHSDTEVILNAWRHWGEDCVQYLRGMFAFAIWDSGKKCLFIARDRVGIKPLYYTMVNGDLYFASELKAFESVQGINRDLNYQALEDYFSLGYIADPKTIYQGVAKLPPAHTMRVALGDVEPKLNKYWDLQFSPREQAVGDELAEETFEKVREAVASHLVADVPLGAFLSGGVDSSAVVAAMAKSDVSAIKTCSIGFDVEAYDETQYARQVAKRYNTEHLEKVVSADQFELVDKLTDIYDEPFADSSALPTYQVCKLARENVKVSLSGDGADELLAGYRRQRLHMNEQTVRDRLPLGLRKAVFGPLASIYPKLDWAPQIFRAKSTFQALAYDAVEAYHHSISMIPVWQRRKLFSESFIEKLGGYESIELFRNHAKTFQGEDGLSLIQHLDFHTWLPGDILVKADRASMATSLEVRVPFLDHQFMEWAATLPSAAKLQQGQGKYVLKKGLEPHLPHDVLYRKKMGFTMPISHWFRGPLASDLRLKLNSEPMRQSGIFNMKYLNWLVDHHQSGKGEHSVALWVVLMFSQFINKQVN